MYPVSNILSWDCVLQTLPPLPSNWDLWAMTGRQTQDWCCPLVAGLHGNRRRVEPEPDSPAEYIWLQFVPYTNKRYSTAHTEPSLNLAAPVVVTKNLRLDRSKTKQSCISSANIIASKPHKPDHLVTVLNRFY